MSQVGIIVEDYVEGVEPTVQDPTDPHEQVEKQFMNKVAAALTKAEEVFGHGDSDVGVNHIVNTRGDLLDMLDDPQIRQWLQWMRNSARCPHRRFQVGD